MYEQTASRRRRESPLLLISSAFLPPPLFIPLRPRRPSSSRYRHSVSVPVVLAASHRYPPRPPADALSSPSLALFHTHIYNIHIYTLSLSFSLAHSLVCSLTGISLSRDLAQSRSRSHCGPPYSLRPFNSIATPFYNAAIRAAGTEVARAPA